MMQDIQRICVAPTDEDREWFPDLAGCEDWRGALRDIWANYRDESFVRQFLSPHLIRKFKLFLLSDRESERTYHVDAIHDGEGYRRLRSALADSYNVGVGEPDIEVIDVDILGNRELKLRHNVRNGVKLADLGKESTLRHIRRLWGYDVKLEEVAVEKGR
jgi:spore cortex formation protein SpoVR/YcgB (stage V sporulation)